VNTELWAHQKDAVEFAAPLPGAMLAMDMGTGKTRVALELLDRWEAQLVLIVAPKSVVPVWPAEFRKHVPDSRWEVLAPQKGSVAEKAEEIQRRCRFARDTGKRLAVVLNYDALTGGGQSMFKGRPCSLMGKTLLMWNWDAVVLDESHRIKDPQGRRSLFLSRLLRKVPRRVALTGTPCPNNPLDIFAQYRAIAPEVFGESFVRFRDRYAVRGGFEGREIVDYRDLEGLSALMYTRMFRVTTDQVLELPEHTDVTRYFILDAKTRAAYNAFERDLVAAIDEGLVVASNALVRLLRLAQIVNGFYVDAITGQLRQITDEPGKAALLREVLEDACGESKGRDRRRRPVVVFGRFREDLRVIRETVVALGLGYAELSGSVNQLEQWQRPDGPEVLGVQLQAGAEGVDFTRASLQVYYSHDYSLGAYKQTRARILRPGQDQPVTYVHLVGIDTVDEDVMQALEDKEDVVRVVVERLKARAKGGKKGKRGRGANGVDSES